MFKDQVLYDMEIDEKILKLPDAERAHLLQLLLFSWVGTSGVSIIHKYNIKMQPERMSVRMFEALTSSSRASLTPYEQLEVNWERHRRGSAQRSIDEDDDDPRSISQRIKEQHEWTLWTADEGICTICEDVKLMDISIAKNPWWYCKCVSATGVAFPHYAWEDICLRCRERKDGTNKEQQKPPIVQENRLKRSDHKPWWYCLCVSVSGVTIPHGALEELCFGCGMTKPVLRE